MATYFVTTNLDVIDANDGVRSLREAIIDANANEGDDLIVFNFAGDEVFYPIELNSALQITDGLRISGNLTTRLVAAEGQRIIEFSSSDSLELRGLILEGGTATSGGGGAIQAFGDLSLDSVTVRNASTSGGGSSGGAVSVSGNLEITNSIFQNNQTTGDAAHGGAVYATGTVTIDDGPMIGEDPTVTQFIDNGTEGSSAQGGAVYALGAIELTNVEFSGNATLGLSASGGAVFTPSTLTIEDGRFEDNTTSGDGASGGAVYAGGDLTVDGTVFENNATGAAPGAGQQAGGDGDTASGGAAYSGAVATLVNALFSGNGTAGENSPGGALKATSAEITNSTFTGNGTTGDGSGGGAIETTNAVEITSSTLTGNTTTGADSAGGAVLGSEVTLANTAAPVSGNSTSGDNSGGGALAARVVATVTDSEIDGNTTTGAGSAGGGVYSAGLASIATSVLSDNTTVGTGASGGGLAADADITVTDSTFLDNATVNTDALGGGIFGLGAVTLSGSNIQDNSTSGGNAAGGGVAALGKLIATATTITGNSTIGTGATGGGIHAGDDVFLVNSTVSGNSTDGQDAQGGGIHAVGTATLTNTTVAANATDGTGSAGGGIYAAAEAVLFKSTVTGNRTDGGDSAGGGLFHAGNALFGDSIVIGNAATGGVGANDVAAGELAGQEIRGSAILDTGTYTAEDLFEITYQLVQGVTAGQLADNGGPVATVKLSEISSNPALDSGRLDLLSESTQGIDLDGDGEQLTLISTDARGEGNPRNVDLPLLGNDGITYGDLGAVESTQANRPPEVETNALSIDEDAAEVQVDVTDNASDPDGDAFQLNGLGDTSALLGTAGYDPLTGIVSYDPGDALQFLGAGETRLEVVNYTLVDVRGGVATGTVDITVTGVNDAPEAEDALRTISENAGSTAFGIVATSVTDADASDSPSITGLSGLTLVENDREDFGTVSISGDGQSVIYDPNGDFFDLELGDTRTVEVAYTVSDGNGGTDTATLSIVIQGSDSDNIPPRAIDDSATVASSSGPAALDVLANDSDQDGDPLTITGIGALTLIDGDQEALGTAAISGDGSRILYDPAGAFDGLEIGETRMLELDYTISDGQDGTDTATLTITVQGTGPNKVPVAEDDSGATETGASILIDVLANDVDPDGDPLSITIVSEPDPSEGRVVLTEDNQLIFRAGPNFVGQTSFEYQATDGIGGIVTSASAGAMVTVEVAEAAVSSDGIALADAQRIAYIYEAGLDRDGNIDTEGLNFWIDALATGFSETEIAQFFLDSPEFEESFGDVDEMSDREFVDQMFINVLGREGDDIGTGFWLGRLASPDFTRADMLVEFSVSPENIAASPEVTTLEEVEPGTWDFA